MKVKHYHNLDGQWFKEIIYTSWNRLNDLKTAYEKKGATCWLNVYNGLTDEWILTVREAQ